RQLFTDLRRTGVKSQAISPALLEFAQFEVEDKHFDEAIAILDDARSFRPAPPLLTQIDFLSAQANTLRGALIELLQTLNKSRVPLRRGQRLRFSMRPPAGSNSVTTHVL